MSTAFNVISHKIPSLFPVFGWEAEACQHMAMMLAAENYSVTSFGGEHLD